MRSLRFLNWFRNLSFYAIQQFFFKEAHCFFCLLYSFLFLRIIRISTLSFWIIVEFDIYCHLINGLFSTRGDTMNCGALDPRFLLIRRLMSLLGRRLSRSILSNGRTKVQRLTQWIIPGIVKFAINFQRIVAFCYAVLFVVLPNNTRIFSKVLVLHEIVSQFGR